MTPTYESYLQALSNADNVTAVEVLEDALELGKAPKELLLDVLIPGQREVGRLWMNGTWSVADEHAATAVAEQALTVVAPPRRSAPTARRIALACAEGEWHTMPARLAAELARTSALDVVMLGPSIPATHLQRYLRAASPTALALSATMPTNLIGASRSIQAARAEGIPVLVGGAAWGVGQHRAHRLGADLHVDDPQSLSLVIDELDQLEGPPPALAAHPIPAEALLLDAPEPGLLAMVLERQSAGNAWMRSMTGYQRDQARQDLGWLARFTAASVACDDPTIVRDLLSWQLALLVPLGVPAAAIIDSCSYLADAIDEQAPTAASILRREAQRAQHAPASDLSS
jgi:methanogenic corrinoid protein MtbC1